jgi:hypothetical protein
MGALLDGSKDEAIWQLYCFRLQVICCNRTDAEGRGTEGRCKWDRLAPHGASSSSQQATCSSVHLGRRSFGICFF